MSAPARMWNGFAGWLGSQAWFRNSWTGLLTRIDRFLIARTGRGVTAPFEGGMLLLNLTAIGAKSGEPRTVPLTYLNEDGAIYVVGTNFGKAHHPGWTANLLANPVAEVESREWSGTVEARLLDDESAESVWPRWIETFSNYEMYRESTTRDIRMFRLHPQ